MDGMKIQKLGFYMINFQWKILELFGNENKLVSVRYLLSGSNGLVTVNSEGNHSFKEGLITKELSQIVESDILQWLEKDTTHDGVNLIKLAVENQLNNLKANEKIDFPWLAGTFTIE
jgi:DNA-binding protein YbaB